MRAEVAKLKDELAPVYKDKARLTEELMQCRESLARVRDINEKHSQALDEATGRIRDLQSRNKELSQQVDNERATQAVAASELEVTEHSPTCHRHYQEYDQPCSFMCGVEHLQTCLICRWTKVLHHPLISANICLCVKLSMHLLRVRTVCSSRVSWCNPKAGLPI